MANTWIRIPIVRTQLFNSTIYGIELGLEVRTASASFVRVPFLFDTGTQPTTVSVALARDNQIPFSLARPVAVRGTTGVGRGFLSSLWFSLPQLPEIQFETHCCFSPKPLSQSLLGLTDVLSNFTFQATRPTRLHPNGSFLLRLKRDHRGQPRP